DEAAQPVRRHPNEIVRAAEGRRNKAHDARRSVGRPYEQSTLTKDRLKGRPERGRYSAFSPAEPADPLVALVVADSCYHPATTPSRSRVIHRHHHSVVIV